MSFYIRKTLRAGPFRMNLSKSGVGVSVGVPGFRVGTGPRGNYVHLGRSGVYYRASFPGATPTARPSPVQAVSREPRPSDVVLEDVTGATTLEMNMSSPSDLLAQVQRAARTSRLWPWAVVASLALSLLGGAATVIALVAGTAATIWLAQRDKVRRSVVVFYDVNDEAAVRFTAINDAFARLRTCERSWNVVAKGAVQTTYQHKVNAGAGTVVQRITGRLDLAGPKVLVTNIVVPSLQTPRRSVYFLPDRMLVREHRSFAEVAYGECTAHARATQFIEDGTVPRDSEVVGSTWRYVNVDGGPDRRFNNNRRLSVLRYGELAMSDPRGFSEVWQFSRPDTAEVFVHALRQMSGQRTR